MAGAFSGHLIANYNPNSPFNSSIVSHGAMTFNPNMHGTPLAQQSFSMFGSQSSYANDSMVSEETAKKIATLQVKLNQKLGPEFISQRPGPGGGLKLTYVEGWKVINLANEVFGFNGWSSSIVNLTTDFVDYNEESRRYSIGVTAVVRVTLRDGVFHEDVGYGMLENSKGKGAALDKCKKEAVTDGLKRALRNFGNVLGNCLYDKTYTAEIVKIKAEPVPKLDQDMLHRRPEFRDVKPNIANPPPKTIQNQANHANPNNPVNYTTPSRPPVHQISSRTHITSNPPQRMDVVSNTSASTSAASKPSGNANPQPPPLVPPDRRVSFADSSGTKPSTSITTTSTSSTSSTKQQSFSDDEYDSCFDTDLFALADLGQPIDDEDVGRPLDVDMGRPINAEEGTLPSPGDEEDDGSVGVHPKAQQVQSNSRAGQQHQQQPQSFAASTTRTGSTSVNSTSNTNGRNSLHRSLSREEQIKAALEGNVSFVASRSSSNTSISASRPGQPAPSSSGSTSTYANSMLPPAVPQRQQEAHTSTSSASAGSSSTTATTSSGSSSSSRLSTTSTSSSSLAQQRHQQYTDRRQQDQNLNPNSNTTASTSNARPALGSTTQASDSAPRRTGMGGGFNFPPGLNIPSTATTTIPPAVIGVKRPAEALSSSVQSFKGGRPGMGLYNPQQQPRSNQQGQQGFGQQRQVLGTLDIGEGGDVKRVRR